MSLFKKFAENANQLEAVKDSVGGGFTVLDTDIYKGTVKMAFLDTWGSGATYVALTLTLDGKDYNENITITNKKGETVYCQFRWRIITAKKAKGKTDEYVLTFKHPAGATDTTTEITVPTNGQTDGDV